MSEEINKGQLMENEQKVLQSHHSQEKSDETNSEKSERKFPVVHEHRCNYCGKMTSKSPCEHCGDVQQITTDKKEGAAIKVDDKKPKKERLKIFIIVTVAVVLLGSISAVAIYNFVNQYSDSSYDETEYEDYDESDNSDGEHITEVPEGYIGIYTAEDFDIFISSQEHNYILMNDIDMSNYDSHHKEVGDGKLVVRGDFNGNNYYLKNYKASEALFYEFDKNGYIHDLYIDNFHIFNDTSILVNNISMDSDEGTPTVIENTHIINSSITCENHTGYLGTIVGSCFKCVIVNCSFDGNISVSISNHKRNYSENYKAPKYEIGGISGFGNCQYCSAKGTLSIKNGGAGTPPRIGGIIGNGYAFRSCNKMNIQVNNKGVYYVGGVVGSTEYYIEQCCNFGNISVDGYSSSVGGVCGGAVVIRDCFNSGDVCGRCAGGIVGSDISELMNSYNIGSVKSIESEFDKGIEPSKGGLCGEFVQTDKTLENCYYTNDDLLPTGNPDFKSPFIKVISFAEAQNEETFSGFDFYEIWTMGDSDYPYPILQGIDYSN